MRRSLDLLYAAALALSALSMAAIAVLVGAQVGGRIYDGILVWMGRPRYGFIIPSLAEISGFLLGASTFLALAGALKAGAHIRVTLILGFLSESARRPFELFALGFTALASGYGAFFLMRLTMDSWRFNELSVGLLPLPLWPAQATMTLGLVLFMIALLDELAIVASGRKATFRAPEDAIALGKEG